MVRNLRRFPLAARLAAGRPDYCGPAATRRDIHNLVGDPKRRSA